MSKVPITVEGAESLRAELKKLKGEDRPRITKAIAEARAHGDIKENAEYHAAKEEQGLCEARLRDIEGKLSNAQVIDISKIPAGDKVIFGITVRLIDVDNLGIRQPAFNFLDTTFVETLLFSRRVTHAKSDDCRRCRGAPRGTATP